MQGAPLLHCGLGMGTAVSMSVARALYRYEMNVGDLDPAVCAEMLGRGKRSAIGTRGSFQGGFIHDDFKDEDGLAACISQHGMPIDWRILLLIDKSAAEGLSGEREEIVFEESPEVSRWKIWALDKMAHWKIVPAIYRQDFGAFAK